MINARILADSVNEYGDRLTTVEATFHRFVLAELNTHRAFSRNSASSRAIPVQKQLDKVRDTPAHPLALTSEQKGMQGGPELTNDDRYEAHQLIKDIRSYTVTRIQEYIDAHPLKEEDDVRLHKSVLNRFLEPHMWHTAIISSTDDGWENFFQQRSSYYTKLAQPEFMAVADMIYDAMQVSEPVLLTHDEWHTPLIQPEDDFNEVTEFGKLLSSLEARKRVSVARCARVSYLTHNGVRDILEDLEMYDRLVSAEPPHWSPLEHVATPALRAEETLGNFKGWHQLRHYGKS